MNTRTVWVKIVSVVIVLAFCGATSIPTGWAQEAGSPPSQDRFDGSSPSEAGLQAASWFLSIPYGAGKLAFSMVGGIVGGLAYVFSGLNERAAKPVWITSMYGTYVITPDHLKGSKPVRFLGIEEEGMGSQGSMTPGPSPMTPAPTAPAPTP